MFTCSQQNDDNPSKQTKTKMDSLFSQNFVCVFRFIYGLWNRILRAPATCLLQWARDRMVDSLLRWCHLEHSALASPLAPFCYLADNVLRNFSDGVPLPAGKMSPLLFSHVASTELSRCFLF